MIPIGMIKERARNSLNRDIFGRVWLKLILCTIVAAIVTALPGLIGSLISMGSAWLGALIGIPLFIVSVLVSGPIEYALAGIYLKLARGEKTIKTSEVFDGFKKCLVESALLGFMRNLFIFLWSLLFIIPGIIKAYAYSMAFYIQRDADGKKPWRVCLDESASLMNGYKGKLFLLDLSFIGWYILGYLLLGVGVLWVVPYHQAARAHFYHELLRLRFGIELEDFAEPDDFEDADDATVAEDEDIYLYDDDDDDLEDEDLDHSKDGSDDE